jgi:hypothetical protein
MDNAEELNALGGIQALISLMRINEEGNSEATEQCVGVLSVVCHISPSCITSLLSCGGVQALIKLISLGDDGLGEYGTQELATKALAGACDGSEGCRTVARRVGARQTVKTVLESPLLESPDAVQRQQAINAKVQP